MEKQKGIPKPPKKTKLVISRHTSSCVPTASKSRKRSVGARSSSCTSAVVPIAAVM